MNKTQEHEPLTRTQNTTNWVLANMKYFIQYLLYQVDSQCTSLIFYFTLHLFIPPPNKYGIILISQHMGCMTIPDLMVENRSRDNTKRPMVHLYTFVI